VAEVRAEISRAADLVEDATGARPTLFRPVPGLPSAAVSTLVAEEKLSEVLGTLATDNSSGSTASSIGEVIETAHRGDIIVMQDDQDDAVRAVPLIAATLREHDLCTGRVVADQTHDRSTGPSTPQGVRVVSW
jgi:peptidoglycan/xylan/chitin deacetylase (PgdA/CDA1 family)